MLEWVNLSELGSASSLTYFVKLEQGQNISSQSYSRKIIDVTASIPLETKMADFFHLFPIHFTNYRRRQNLCISILRLGQSNSRKEWFFFTPNFPLQLFLYPRDLVMVGVWGVFIQLVDSAKCLYLRVGHKFFFGISQLPNSSACPL